jgi:GNAT superfamily N-acetyltransferase
VLYGRFDASRAGRPAHAYLSLLATHPEHQGRGIGQRLLADDLEMWDVEGVPALPRIDQPRQRPSICPSWLPHGRRLPGGPGRRLDQRDVAPGRWSAERRLSPRRLADRPTGRGRASPSRLRLVAPPRGRPPSAC